MLPCLNNENILFESWRNLENNKPYLFRILQTGARGRVQVEAEIGANQLENGSSNTIKPLRFQAKPTPTQVSLTLDYKQREAKHNSTETKT